MKPDPDHVEPFPLDPRLIERERRDTDISEFQGEVMPDSIPPKPDKAARSEMSEKALLLLLHERLDENDRWRAAVDKRLDEGARQFEKVDADLTIAFNWMRELSLDREKHEIAASIERHLEERKAANGSFPEDPEAPTVIEPE